MFIEVRGVVDNNYILLYNYYNKRSQKEIKISILAILRKGSQKGPFLRNL